MSMNKELVYKTKVYYEDTDIGGVVYYANYLKFIERARTEAIISFGLSNTKLIKDYDTYIIVKSCKIDFKKTAKLEDDLKVFSYVTFISKASFKMIQKIKRDDDLIASALVHLVAVNSKGKPVKINDFLKKKLNFYLVK
tara:strand:- start:415 stop:831 length:417 start_codon:yes stop_codon:yes gene_type:complete